MRRQNYLNNKDILKEIHKSKTSYCSYSAPEFADYDLILQSITEIPNSMETARLARADRLTKIAQDLQNIEGKLAKSELISISPESIKDSDIIFRVMTWEHIPFAPPAIPKPPKNKKNKIVESVDEIEPIVTEYDDVIPEIVAPGPIKYVKVNFPPFMHFRVVDDGTKTEVVGKSHWFGPLKTGHYSRDHGKITSKLALMYIKLCEKYGTRSNWRNYCVDEQTEALTQRGWLGVDQINENDIILSYSNSDLKWSKIKSIYRGNFDGQMHYLTTSSMDALVTPNHKFVTKRGLIPAELILESDKVIFNGNAVDDPFNFEKIYSDDLVELVGWIVTEGCYEHYKNSSIKTISISQNDGEKANRIRQCLTNLNFTFSEKPRENVHCLNKNISFRIYRKDALKIKKLLPTKNLTMDFIVRLSANQRLLLINTMIDGDGWRTGPQKKYMRYVQKDKTHIDLFRILCSLSGLRSNIYRIDNHMSFGKPVTFYSMNIFTSRKNQTSAENIDFHGGKRNGLEHPGQGKSSHPNQPTIQYKGKVWCPETEYGCFMARRNDKIYLTGNTYNDEMRSQALLQLSQIGLQFDESKSQNPFAYYTAAVTNSFTRVLNIEKRNQNIRDDILEMNNLTPSYTRQNSGSGGSYSDYSDE